MLTWGILRANSCGRDFATATYYCLFAVAFSLVLKVNKIWNFAQAGVMVFSYYSPCSWRFGTGDCRLFPLSLSGS